MSMGTPNTFFVGKRQQFTGEDSRLLVRHGERNIAVICHHNQFYAVDNACYHHGGPLLMGDIEDVGGHPCLVCPWHKYLISLQTGEGLYRGLDFPDTVTPEGVVKPVPCIKSKGSKQRLHRVEVRGDDVLLLINNDPIPLESDTYATMERANRETPTGMPVEKPPGLLRSSGDVLHSSRSSPFPSSGVSGTVIKSGYWAVPKTMDVAEGQRHCSRAGVNPLLASATPHATAEGLAYFVDLFISVRRIADVCDDTREVTFVPKSGSMKRQFELGEVITVQLANNRKQILSLVLSGQDELGYSTLVRRSSHSTDENSKGNEPSHDEGRNWFYEFSLYSVMPVLSIRGNFTLVDHMKRVRAFQGRVLWLTAGMGVASSFAAMQIFLGPPMALQDVAQRYRDDALMVVHLHVERRRSRIPKLNILLEWSQRHAPQLQQEDKEEGAKNASASGASHGEQRNKRLKTKHHADSGGGNASVFAKSKRTPTFIFHAFLTQEAAPSPLPAAVSLHDALSEFILTGQPDHEPGTSKDLSSELLPTYTYGRRPCHSDVHQAVHHYFGSVPFLVYVSGPSKFVAEQVTLLESLGVAKARIVTSLSAEDGSC